MRSCTIMHGGDLNENGDCKDGKLVMHAYNFLCGGDTCNFKDGKLVMHGYKMHGYKMHGYKILYGVNLNEHCNFRDGKLFISSFRIEGLTLFSPALSKKIRNKSHMKRFHPRAVSLHFSGCLLQPNVWRHVRREPGLPGYYPHE